MAEINARALMFSLAPEDASDSTTAAKIARYAERKHLAYNLTKEGALSQEDTSQEGCGHAAKRTGFARSTGTRDERGGVFTRSAVPCF